MKQLLRVPLAWLLALTLVSTFTATAQVQTARPNVTIGQLCKGYYEYLPQGYDPNGTTTYPMILFLTGRGEFGNGGTQLSRVLKNGPPMLIQEGRFPTSFSVLGKTFKFIVITPQFTTAPVSSTDVDAVVEYMLARYKVDTKRLYITGLSYGGGLSFAYPGSANTAYRSKIAASVPVASPLPDGGNDTIYARSRRIAAGNIPVWATHNKYDRYPDSSLNTITYVNDINISPAPNPLARMTIFNISGHDAWTKTYDPDYRENGYNVYEWMLLYQKGSAPPPPNQGPTVSHISDKTITQPTNSVSVTATASDPDGDPITYTWQQLYGPAQATITAPSSASTSFSALAQGYYKFRVTVSDSKGAKAFDDFKVTVNQALAAGSKLIQVNVYGGSNSYSNSAWNNWSVGSGAGTTKTSASFKYSDGTASAVTAVLSHTLAANDNGAYYKGGMTAPEVLRYASYDTSNRTLTLNGLSASKHYNLEFYASRASSTAGSTTFLVNGTSVTVNAYNNFTSKAVFTNVVPSSSGQIVISIKKNTTYNYLNGFTITENTTATATNKYVKMNLYGGTNPYANSEWNNWNVSASSTISTVKYSDATVSPVKATLSPSSAVGDNGSAYGGTMAPPEVLRYASYSSGTRTLTISGLSTAKTYDLELYASRANTGNTTIFTIGTKSISIVTDNNKTNKAVFTSLVPNSSGQIVVTISKSGSYDYLNGFILTENSSGSTLKQDGGALEIVTERGNPAHAATVRAFPNPTTGAIQLQLQSGYTGMVDVQVADASGRVQKEWRFAKANTALQHTLSVTDLPQGLYFITVRMGEARQTVPVSKIK